MIKGILLDMGGVIIDLDMEGCIAAYKNRIRFSKTDECLDPCHMKGFFNDFEAGLLPERDFLAKVKADSRPGISDEEVFACQQAILLGIEPGKAAYLKALSGRYPLFLLSNNNPISMRRCREIFRESGIPAEELFRELFLSYEMKMIKPGADIFLEAVRRTGFRPDELLFIDDSAKNVSAAIDLGINAALYTPGTDLAALIEAFLR